MVPPEFHGFLREEERQQLLRCLATPLGEEEQIEAYQRMTRRRSFVFSCFFFGVSSFITSQRSGIVGNAWSSAVEIVKATEGHDAWKATFWGGNFFELSDGIVPSDRMRTENCEAMISGLTTVSYKKCSIFLEGVVDRIVVLRFNYLVFPSIYPTENR